MDILNTTFNRLFSQNFYKSLTLSLARSSFEKDFVNTDKGDLYPLFEKSEDAIERVTNGCYTAERGYSKRFFTRFFPYASYEITADLSNGSAGFSFIMGEHTADVFFDGFSALFSCGNICEKKPIDAKSFDSFIISLRPGAFDIFAKKENKALYLFTFRSDLFKDSNVYSLFKNAKVLMYVSSGAIIKEALSYIDSGISIADMRPIRYENLEIMREGGKVFFTASIRMCEGTFQGVFSWIPSSAEFSLEGAVFYDCGNGRWCSDVAASLLYNRKEEKWQLWVCSFGNGHILGSAQFDGDIRFGVNVLDITLMPRANDSDISQFAAFSGDEDPDFFYDEKTKKWRMAICRLDPKIKAYRYVFFESERPFDGYTCVGMGYDGAETGGSFVKINDELYFVCGNSFQKRANYRIYHKGGMKEASFDLDDGGFRGWGSILPIKCGSRTRYFWLTFDRHRGSDYNWSYGNLYCFEAPMD